MKVLPEDVNITTDVNIERVFRAYFKENPLASVYDLEDCSDSDEENATDEAEPSPKKPKIEVEYMHGYFHDVLYCLEYDKRARLDLLKRKKDFDPG